MPSHHPRGVAAAQRLPLDAVVRPEDRGVVSRVAPLEGGARGTFQGRPARPVNGVFASAKNGRPIPWATRDERDLACLLELDPSVRSYEAAPERVSLVLDGRTVCRVPAYRATTRRGPVVLDAFPARGAGSRERERLVRALTELYADRGVPYRALSGADIRVEPRFRNARWLLARRAHQPSRGDVLLVTGALSVSGRRTLDELRAELPGVEDVASVVAPMAVAGLVRVDLSAAEHGGMSASLEAGGAW